MLAYADGSRALRCRVRQAARKAASNAGPFDAESVGRLVKQLVKPIKQLVKQGPSMPSPSGGYAGVPEMHRNGSFYDSETRSDCSTSSGVHTYLYIHICNGFVFMTLRPAQTALPLQVCFCVCVCVCVYRTLAMKVF